MPSIISSSSTLVQKHNWKTKIESSLLGRLGLAFQEFRDPVWLAIKRLSGNSIAAAYNMDAILKKSAEDGDINLLYSILASDQDTLKRMNVMIVVDTPLQIAARVGNTHYAMEIASLIPSLAWKLNHNGFSPIHLALENGHDGIVRRVVKIDKQLLSVKTKGGLTTLHLAAQMDNVDILVKFLHMCPSAIEDLTVRLETAMHIAIKNNNFRAFKVLWGWLQRVDKEKILKRKDEDGNTAFHIAICNNQPKVMKLLIGYVDVNCKNYSNLTAQDIFHLHKHSLDSEVGDILRRVKAKRCSELTIDYKVTRADRFSREYLSFLERRNKYLGISRQVQKISLNDVQNVVLVVAILIATASSYQAILNPPGGYWQDDGNPSAKTTLGNTTISAANTTLANTATSNITEQQSQHVAGQMIMKPTYLFLFFTMNTIAFELSILAIIVVIIEIPYSRILTLSSVFLFSAYVASISLTFPAQNKGKVEGGHSQMAFIAAFSVIAPTVTFWVLYKTKLPDLIDNYTSITARTLTNFLGGHSFNCLLFSLASCIIFVYVV